MKYISLSLFVLAFFSVKRSASQANGQPPQPHDTLQIEWCKYLPHIHNVSTQTKSLPTGPLPPNAQITCGNIRVTFMDVVNGSGFGFDDPVLGATRRNCVCNVMGYVQSVIVFPASITPANPVDVLFNPSQNNPSSSTLAFASPVFPPAFFASTPGYYSGYVYDFITTGVNPAPPNEEHGQITVNFGKPYTYCTPVIGNCDYDFQSVILHEFTHLLGIGSLMTENTTSGFLESGAAPNVFTEFDHLFLYYYNGSTFDKMVDIVAFAGNGGINPALPANLFTYPMANNVWLKNSPFANRDNQPVSSSYGFSPGTSLSHFDEYYYTRTHVSPAFSPNYVMNGYIKSASFKNVYTKEDVQALELMGYVINPAGLANYPNTAPNHVGNVIQPTTYNFPDSPVPAGNTNLVISTSNCNPVTINVGGNFITDGSLTHSLGLYDVDGDPLSVYNGQVFNLRGCGNGGNNNNQLTVSGSNSIITFTPRPNFAGRAQFAFHLYDGKDRGAYIVITIDVVPDVCFNNGTEHVVNGNLEEGQLLRTVPTPNTTLTADGIDVGYHYYGNRLCDGQQVISLGWQDQNVRESYQNCLFGPALNSFPSPGTGFIPNGGLGDRYTSFAIIESFNQRLAPALLACHNYVMRMDVRFNASIAVGTIIPLKVSFKNTPTGADLYTIPAVVTTVTNTGAWQTISFAFSYTNPTPANYIFIDPNGFGYCYVDNISVMDDTGNPSVVPVVSVTSSGGPFCAGVPVTLTASGAVTYSWSPATGLSATTGATVTATPASTTTYTVIGTDASGCQGSTTITVPVNPTPYLSFTPSSPSYCAGGSTVITVSGANTYSWSPATGLSSTTGSTVTASPATTTTYTVTGTNTSGCIGTGTVTVTVNPTPVVNVSPATFSLCGGGGVTLTASGASSYTWSPATGLSSTTGAVVTASPTSTTTYTVTGTNSSGCSASANATVNVGGGFSINIIPSATTICANDPVTLTVIGAPPSSTFSWSPTGSGNPATVSPATTTTYTVTVTDPSGCTVTGSVTINVLNSCCTAPPGNTVIPASGDFSSSYPSGFTGTTIAINGNFTVNTSFTISGIPNILMGANAKIIVTPGNTLTINVSRLYSCGPDMWDGIEIQPGGNLVMTRVRIEDAKIGVLSQNGTGISNYYIDACTFNRNHTGVRIENHFTSTLHPGIIRSTMFDCQPWPLTGNIPTLDAPFTGQYSRYGVEIDAVNSVTIGDPGSPFATNRFRFLQVGVKAASSVYTLYNNDFRNHVPTPLCFTPFPTPPGFSCPVIGWSVWANKCQSLIGGPGANQPNNFQDVNNAIFNENGYNFQVYNNTFKNVVSPSFLVNSMAIYMKDFQGGAISIIQNNDFENLETGIFYRNSMNADLRILDNVIKKFTLNGIYCLQNQGGQIRIDNNNFNQAVNSVYSGNIAVNVSNSVLPLSASPIVFVTDNDIYRVNKGILMVDIRRPQIVSNHILFPSTISPITPNLYYGIRAQNGDVENIRLNVISKTGGFPNASYENALYGISVETNATFTSVMENSVNRMGTGLRFRSYANANSTVFCNIMNYSWSGLTLDAVNIGQQGQSATMTPPFGTASDNRWSTLPGPMAGAVSTRGLAGWTSVPFYTRTGSLPWCPLNANQSPTFTILTNPNFGVPLVPSAPQNCSNICYNPPCFHPVLAKIATDQSPFNQVQGNERFMMHQGLVSGLMADTVALDTTNADDMALKYFLDTTLAVTNIGLIADVSDRFKDGDTLGAESLNQVIVPKNCAEEFHKAVNEIFFRTWAKGIFFFSPQDTTTLYNIAIQDPLICGRAIYDARVMLNLDINDYSVDPTYHSAQAVTDEPGTKNGNLYPNPGSDEVYYEAELGENESGIIQVYDISGKLQMAVKLNAGNNRVTLDVSALAMGMYHCKIVVNGIMTETHKLVIQR